MLEIKHATASDIPEIQKLIRTVFDQAVAPLYSEEGKQEFYKYISPTALSERLEKDHLLMIACKDQHYVGVVEARNCSHISMLFVDTGEQRKGIGRTLLTEILKVCRYCNPNLQKVTVHSSPNSVSAYERFGFSATGQEEELHGIRFVTMELSIQELA